MRKLILHRTSLLFVAAVTLVASLALADSNPPSAGVEPGSVVTNFTLKDYSGAEHSLQSMLEGSKFVIVDFWSTKCPFSRGYEAKLKEIAKDYAGKGIKVLAVMSNQTETADDIQRYVQENPLPYTVVIDPDSAIADRFGAQTTPHVFVLDSTGKVRYVGGIDSNLKNPEEAKPYLRQALDALVAGSEPPQLRTRNFGCSIKRKRA